MKNKIELKKYIILSLIVILIFSIININLEVYQYKKYNRNYNNKINSIIGYIINKYPNMDKNKIVNILNNDKKVKNVLIEYGIDLKSDSAILENDNYFKYALFINSVVIITLSLILLMLFLKYNYNKNKKLNEITNYIKEINKKNYKIDIDDYTEDELSILKDEIYKTTIMLKEQAEISLRDKINLKNHLEDISHQLKTPLTSINIMLDNILDNPDMDFETRNEFIKDIEREINNINFLVLNILKLSKFDSNTITFDIKTESLDKIIKEVIKNVSPLCDLMNVKINYQKTNIKLNCDFKWQVEALTNILKNSIEYSNSKDIDIILSENKIYIEVIIKDYGSGIDSNDLKNCFKRFYRGKNSNRDSIGIGLSLAKEIINKNNGDIKVMSKLNEGTMFKIKYYKR